MFYPVGEIMSDMPRLAIVGTNSGCGKTTAVLALESALLKRGLPVTSFKCGPDYIDGAFHRRLQHIDCYNLDSIFLKDAELKRHFAEHAQNKFSIIEGVMGMFDGVGSDGKGSSFEIATKLKIPTVLIINARGMSTSVRAVIRGFKEFSDDHIDGVIFTNISKMTYPMLEECCTKENVRCYGFLPSDKKIAFESRHLGLVGSGEIEDFNEKMEYLGSLAEEHIKIDELIDLAYTADTLKSEESYEDEFKNDCPLTMAVARDDAFCFIYQENLDILENMNVKIVYFSPISDDRLPSDIDALYLPGGYPELHLDELSSNYGMLKDIKERVEGGLPTLAECGGFLYLHRSVDGRTLVSLFDESATKESRLQNFGYGTLESKNDNLMFRRGESTYVHEFHYYSSTDVGDTCVKTKLRNGVQNDCVVSSDTLFAGFPHLYFPSNLNMVRNLIRHMKEFREAHR